MTDLGRQETHKVDAVERLQAEHKIWTISHKKVKMLAINQPRNY